MAHHLHEDQLRDLLIGCLDVIEPGLQFLDKEAYVPNELGTRGFIDIFTRDAQGHFVLIELKRSDASSREAIHEVLKYVENVKRHLGVRDDEIRVIIASTDWRELHVPFSRFCSDTNLEIKGVKIIVSNNAETVEARQIKPLIINQGRFIAPWHELNLYIDEESMKRGITEYEDSCRNKGVEDYILLLLSAPAGLHASSLEQTRAAIIENISRMGGEPDEAQISASVSKMKEYRYILYFGMQLLTREKCLSIIAKDKKQLDEVKETITEMGEEEELCYLHESIGNMNPRPHNDYYEIGYPAKLRCRLLESEGWTIVETRRYGAFQRNIILTDTEVLDELCGESGESDQRYKKRISIANRAHVSTIKADLSRVLETNNVWLNSILIHLDEIEAQHPLADVEIMVFHPSTALITLYLAATR